MADNPMKDEAVNMMDIDPQEIQMVVPEQVIPEQLLQDQDKEGLLVLIHPQNPPVFLTTNEHLTALVNKFQLNPEFHIVRMPYYDTEDESMTSLFPLEIEFGNTIAELQALLSFLTCPCHKCHANVQCLQYPSVGNSGFVKCSVCKFKTSHYDMLKVISTQDISTATQVLIQEDHFKALPHFKSPELETTSGAFEDCMFSVSNVSAMQFLFANAINNPAEIMPTISVKVFYCEETFKPAEFNRIVKSLTVELAYSQVIPTPAAKYHVYDSYHIVVFYPTALELVILPEITIALSTIAAQPTEKLFSSINLSCTFWDGCNVKSKEMQELLMDLDPVTSKLYISQSLFLKIDHFINSVVVNIMQQDLKVKRSALKTEEMRLGVADFLLQKEERKNMKKKQTLIGKTLVLDVSVECTATRMKQIVKLDVDMGRKYKDQRSFMKLGNGKYMTIHLKRTVNKRLQTLKKEQWHWSVIQLRMIRSL